MTPPSSSPAEAAPGAAAPLSWLHDGVVFLARFLGTPVQMEPLRAVLAAQTEETLGADELDALLQHAGLVGTALPAHQARRPTEMPALLLGDEGRALAVLALNKEGRYEVHLPGIEGSTWLDAQELAREVPNGRWVAVRPVLFFDQRSLLYSLPQVSRWFWDTFDRSRWMFRWALIGTLGLNIFSALVPFYSMAVYDRVLPNNAINSLWVLTSAVMLVVGFEFMMRMLRSQLLESAARRMDVALSAQVFAQCLRMRAANRPASGGVLANTVRDFEAVREFFATGTLTVLGELPFLFLYLAIIALVAGWLVLVPILMVPLLLGVAWSARRPLAKQVADSVQESSQRTAHLFETMNGLDTVKALGAEAWSRRKWEGLTQAIAANSLETRELMARINYGNAALMSLSNVAVVATGAYMMSHDTLTMGQIIAATMLTGRALAPISQIANLIVRWQQTKLSFEALNKIMAAETDDSVGSLQAPPLKGAVEFRDVTFGYPNMPPILERLNVKIRPGERVGIIGRLGSGKSTVLKLLLNQYAPDSGSVLVDNLVNTQLEPLSLRRQIGYVPQDVTLFHGTLRENIELGRVQTNDVALLDAMRVACLDEILPQLPGGVGTQVGERGERLSGGQRQAVAIARALLTKPRLLLLDEPSSMIDPATENRLITNLRALTHTTIILVTHRMAMLGLVDRLLVFDRGRLVADGPRDEVLKALTQARPPESAAPPGAAVRSPAAKPLQPVTATGRPVAAPSTTPPRHTTVPPVRRVA